LPGREPCDEDKIACLVRLPGDTQAHDLQPAFTATPRAFRADGQAYNGASHKGSFPDCEAIADFLQVLC
jgi:hypothetical protein